MFFTLASTFIVIPSFTWITKIFKVFIKIEKTIINFGDIEIKKQELHQDKIPRKSIDNSIKSIDSNKIAVSNEVSFGKKKDLSNSLSAKMLKKIDLFVYSFPKWKHLEENLIKLNIYIYF